MTIFALRIFIFTILPLAISGAVILIDRTAATRERRLEILLIFLFALGVAGSGIGNFIGHFFLSDMVADSIGWPEGSPFQLEIAFANLAVGVLGVGAVGRRDGYREATVIAVSIFGIGATIVHILDIAATGNLAPGNSLQNISNILKPALLILFLTMSRRAEKAPGSETSTSEFDRWRMPIAQGSGLITACVTTAFGLGFALNQAVLMTFLGALLGFGIILVYLIRSPWHQLRWFEN